MEEVKEVVNVGELLTDTIIEEIYNVREADPDKRKQVIEELERLYKLRIEENKAADDYYNNEQRRIMEKAIQDERIKIELQTHQDKMKLEFERLESDRINMAKDIKVKELQAQTEKQKMWAEIGTKGTAMALWVVVSYAVVKIEQTGMIRSKAFTGTIPKLKFW